MYTESAIADPQDLIVDKLVNYQIPKGTPRIGVRIEIFSQEFPVFTQQQSKYNDLWVYDLVLPDGSPLQQSGKVNQTHVTAGTYTVERCLDVGALTKDGPVPLTGRIAAQNVADALLPTSVTLWVSTSCGKLEITKFKGRSTTANGQFVLSPRITAASVAAPDGNLAGQYLSLPLSAALPASFGIPATLKFEPSDAKITEVEVFQRAPNGDSSLGKVYLGQAQAKPSELQFASLALQPAALTPRSERVQIVAVLRGTLPGDNTPAESDPMELTVDDQWSSFSPIYLSSELAAYQAANRFGTQVEAGGDSWSTLAMANWLFGAGLRYNDVSAANVKQTATGRSVLDHAGHSDAQQADLRYWDGNGGFTDALGGSNNAQGLADLAAAARAEVTANAVDRPNLTRLTAWITQNRANLSAYAARAEARRIYIGKLHVTDLLIKGVFPGTSTRVPGVQAWDTKPAKIKPQSQHLDHWHINTNNL